MRVGYIGSFGDWHTELGVAEALEKGVGVDRYEFRSLDPKRFTAREYDLVLTTAPYCQPPEFWRRQRRSVAHYFDLITHRGRQGVYMKALPGFDLILATDANHPVYRGLPARWFPQAYNPRWYYPVAGEPERDVAFIGHAYGGRGRLFRKLASRYSFEHFGRDNQCRGEAHARVCATTRVMVCDNARNDLPGYWSNRVYLHLACGAFVLHPGVPGMEEFFTDGIHLAYYTDDLFEKIDYYLSHENERREIARAGLELVRDRHTWDARMDAFWKVCESGSLDIPTSPPA
jgi:hypothetical protein